MDADAPIPVRAWDEQLRARGYRVTPQRQLVLEAVSRLDHATPDAIRPLITVLDERHGFETDVGHLTVFGRCAECRVAVDV
ncbi:MAG: hypothetical protein ACRDPY_07435 [Streptosporangiaceae bacterium]